MSIMDHSFSIQKKKYSCKSNPFGDIYSPSDVNKIEDPDRHNKCLTQECKDAVLLADTVNSGSPTGKDRLIDSKKLPISEAFKPLLH